ncbi:hypothetical protein [Spirosoma sp.]|uniref:hypothetical protein n=1 Tax=Spirosoma sp. TaxID=1899569 RepID=UPI003B3BB62A
MRQAIFLLLTWFTTNLSNPDDPIIKVTRAATNVQIKQTEQQALQQYGVKAEIKVLERNSAGEITSLTCVRMDRAGKESSSCSSDNFGLLIITRNGCKIADLGYESQI